jgi:uncharacterized membrane protein YdjX (TVP38/TMEM64 family)
MKPFIKIFLVLWAVFTSLLIIAKFSGFLSLEFIESMLSELKSISPFYVGAAVSCLLMIDFFIAIPTLSVCILSGYLLGFEKGALFSVSGLMLSGCVGYWMSFYGGQKLMDFILKDQGEQLELKQMFSKYGFSMTLLSRAAPLLPEMCACLSGVTKIRFSKFLLQWSLSAVPYGIITAYSGSISSLENPLPAILTAIGLSLALSLVWFVFRKKAHYKDSIDQPAK